jgi:phospholipid-translocating P-type ATPase (flippase)
LREIKIQGSEYETISVYPDNTLTLSRYTWLSILPKNLFEQFQRPSNVWFVIVSIFQLIPFELNPTDSWTTILPLSLLLLITLLKDAYVDLKLRKQDEINNKAQFQFWDGTRFVFRKSQELLVGHIVIVNCNETVPADMLLIDCLNDSKWVYADNSKLNGTSVLTKVNAIEKHGRMVIHIDDTFMINTKFHCIIKISEPNHDYSAFYGRLKLAGDPGSLELKANNLLFKGSVFTGCERVVGICMYCGYESKLQLNSKKIYHKTSRMETKLNNWVVFILIVLVFIVSFCVLGFYVIGSHKSSGTKPEDSMFLQPIITFVLLFNNIIPISLFMVIDIIRILQSYVISKKNPHISFNNERLNENLGQVDYILTDKTGTITENSLKVRSICVDNKMFHISEDERIQTEPNKLEIDLLQCKPMEDNMDNTDYLRSLLDTESGSEVFKEFVKCMTLCNTLTKFKSEFLGSNDEKALVKFAEIFGYKLVHVSKNLYVLKVQGQDHSYEVVASSQFNSKTKKSRVLLYEYSENFGVLYFKGDPYRSMGPFNLSKDEKAEIQRKCNEMNEKGLRTMVLGYKKIPLEDLADFRSRIKKAEHSLVNVEGKIEAVFKELEDQLQFLGFTCIEEEVMSETIHCVSSLKKSNIKIWLVSGDSYGNTNLTSIASKIVDVDSEKVYLEGLDQEHTCFKALKSAIFSYIFDDNRAGRMSFSINGGFLVTESLDGDDDSLRGYSSVQNSILPNTHSVFKKISNVLLDESDLNRPVQISKLDYCVFIDRSSFLTALNHESCRKLLVILLVCARSVVFSRLMPEDKVSVVKLLKKNVSFNPVVMAIGQGEGDISMLQSSDIGVAVNSQESSLIRNFSDVRVTTFADLEQLLLVHGHWNYSRLSRAILLFLYKNFLLTSMLFTYTLVCSFTGTSLFDATLLVGYNIFFTTLPVLVLGIFDEDLPEEVLTKNREVYFQGSKGKLFCSKLIFLYGGLATLHWGILSALLFACVPSIITASGHELNLDFLGTVVYITMISAVLVQIHLDCYSYSLLYYLSLFLSVIFVLSFVLIQDNVGFVNNLLIGVGQQIKSSPYAFFSIFFTSLACIIPSYAARIFKELFFPNIVEQLRAGKMNLKDVGRLDEFDDMISKIYCNSSSWKNSSQDDKFSMSKYTLRYNLPYMESEYEELFKMESSTIIKVTVCAIWLLLILWTIFTATLFESDLGYKLARIIITAGFGVLVFLMFTEHFWYYYKYYILGGIFAGLVIKFILELSFNLPSILATALVPLVTNVLLNVDWFSISCLNILNVIFGIISFSIFYDKDQAQSALSISRFTTLIIAITATSSIVGYYLVLSKKTEHKLMSLSSAGIERTQSILSLLLPPFVRNRVKDGVRYIAEAQDEVSVLFCDICDFESICREYKPNDLRLFLDSLFKIFDNLCENTGVTKIETVGKTYMACAGLSDSDQELPQSVREVNHARRVIELANSMLQEVSLIRLANGNKLQVKIGINSGPVIAGVVGHHKPQFSLVGDTVNTASRMCSTLAEYNSVQITAATHAYLKSFGDLTFRTSSVEAKGKGKMDTFIVCEVKYENSSDIAGGPNCTRLSNPSVSGNTSMNNTRRSKSMIFESFQTMMESKMIRKSTGLISTSSWFHTRCKESEKEKKFRINGLVTTYKVLLYSLIIALITYLCNLAISLFEFYYLSNFSNKEIIIGRGIVIAFIAVIISFHKKVYQYLFYPTLISLVLMIMLLVALLNLIYSTDTFIDFTALEIMYVIVILNHSTGASLFMVLVANICVFVPWIVLVSFSSNVQLNVSNLLLVACFSGINFFAIFIQEKKNRSNFNLNFLADREIKETEKLLVQMMPPNVLEDLQNDKICTDKQKEITILFADIVGFTNWSADKCPEDVVMMLSQLFTRFDKKCVENDVYKVHTIGDCYVVLGYNGKSLRDPLLECLNVVKMAKDMIEIIKDENRIHSSELNMRIGIHVGDVIGGIIGTNTVRYDIWGPDVLIANKMESSGKAGSINVSEDARRLLMQSYTHSFSFIQNAEVNIESLRRNMRCFFMES